MTLNDIVARCSKFSGYNLVASINDGVLTIEDKAVGGASWLVLTLGPCDTLREVYGRLRQWGINGREYEVLVGALKFGIDYEQHCTHFREWKCGAPMLRRDACSVGSVTAMGCPQYMGDGKYECCYKE